MLRHTSVDGAVYEVSSSYQLAYLYDFDIDGYELKSKHRDYLETKLVSKITAGGMAKWRISLCGIASRPGKFTKNMKLSMERAASVQSHLLGKLGSYLVDYNTAWVGELPGVLTGRVEKAELAGYRAVLVCLNEFTDPPPPPIQRPVLPDCTTTTRMLAMRTLWGSGVGDPSPPDPVYFGQSTFDSIRNTTQYTLDARDYLSKKLPWPANKIAGNAPVLGDWFPPQYESPKYPVYFEIMEIGECSSTTTGAVALYRSDGFYIEGGTKGIRYGPWNPFEVSTSLDYDDFAGNVKLDRGVPSNLEGFPCSVIFVNNGTVVSDFDFGGPVIYTLRQPFGMPVMPPELQLLGTYQL